MFFEIFLFFWFYANVNINIKIKIIQYIILKRKYLLFFMKNNFWRLDRCYMTLGLNYYLI